MQRVKTSHHESYCSWMYTHNIHTLSSYGLVTKNVYLLSLTKAVIKLQYGMLREH